MVGQDTGLYQIIGGHYPKGRGDSPGYQRPLEIPRTQESDHPLGFDGERQEMHATPRMRAADGQVVVQSGGAHITRGLEVDASLRPPKRR
jgi:hypothetical protein